MRGPVSKSKLLQFAEELGKAAKGTGCIYLTGGIDFYHYDFYGQVLSKVERDLDKDRTDVEWVLRAKLVKPAKLLELFRNVEPQLVRFPAIDPVSLRERLERMVGREAS